MKYGCKSLTMAALRYTQKLVSDLLRSSVVQLQ